MMKLVILVLVLFVPVRGYAATYWYAYDWFEARHKLNLQSAINATNEPEDDVKSLLNRSSFVGLTLKEDKLYSLYDSDVFIPVGRLEKCDGLADTCVIMDGYFKLYLPKDFDFTSQRKWTWGTCQYVATAKTSGKILGVEVERIHVNAICSDFMFELIEFDIDKDKGVTHIEVSAKGVKISYILATEMGFFAKDPQGHYHF